MCCTRTAEPVMTQSIDGTFKWMLLPVAKVGMGRAMRAMMAFQTIKGQYEVVMASLPEGMPYDELIVHPKMREVHLIGAQKALELCRTNRGNVIIHFRSSPQVAGFLRLLQCSLHSSQALRSLSTKNSESCACQFCGLVVRMC